MRLKKVMSVLLVSGMVFAQPITNLNLTGLGNVKAASASCETYSGTNVEAQDYDRWSAPIQSYLSACADGKLMRVQYGNQIEGILIEYYDSSYHLLSTKTVPAELPLFGAFYETSDNYFLLTGQNNSKESAEVEVYRITKYDKNWKRIASVGLKDCNTTVPFDAGSARMDTSGNTLVIRTCHEMYQSSDGKNHQANVTIKVDMPAMKITESFTSVANVSVGYVSHSFNQFVKYDGSNLVTLDHGDAYPRSMLLRSGATNVDILTFKGQVGENRTGAAAGGLELSDSSYLVAGHSVVQDTENLTRKTRNVFVAAVPKGTAQVNMNWLTDYKEGDGTTSTPHMVKIDNNRFMVLWSRDGQVYYTEVNGKGTKVGDTYHLQGNLSDCVPVIYKGKLIWYTWNNGTISFYEINLSNYAQTHVETVQNGHRFEEKETAEGKITFVCSVCGESLLVPEQATLKVLWNENGGDGYYSSSFSSDKKVGETLYYWASEINGDTEVIITNPELVSCTPNRTAMGILTMLKPGNVKVVIRSQQNPEQLKMIELHITEDSNSASELERIKEEVSVYKEETVTSSDKEAITKLVGDMEALLKSGSLKENEITEVKRLKADCEKYLAKIAEVEGEISRLTAAVNGYSEENITSVGKAPVEQSLTEINALMESKNLTNAQKSDMAVLKDKCENLLKIFEDMVNREQIEAELARIREEMGAYNEENVKPTDQEKIEELIRAIDELLAADGIKEIEISELNQLKSNGERYISRISYVLDKVTQLTAIVNGYTEENIESIGKIAVERTMAEIDALMKTDNLTAAMISNLNALKVRCGELLKLVENTEEADRKYIESEIAKIRERIGAYSEENVKSSDKAAIEGMIAEIHTLSAFQGLTETEMSELDQFEVSGQKYLERIAEVEGEISRLTEVVNGYLEEKPELINKDAVKQTSADIDALLNTENLTDTEQTLLSSLKRNCMNLLTDTPKKGDIDKNGKVDLTDLMMCLNHVSKKKLLEGEALIAADIDGKNGVTLSDLMRILNYVSKKTDTI